MVIRLIKFDRDKYISEKHITFSEFQILTKMTDPIGPTYLSRDIEDFFGTGFRLEDVFDEYNHITKLLSPMENYVYYKSYNLGLILAIPSGLPTEDRVFRIVYVGAIP